MLQKPPLILPMQSRADAELQCNLLLICGYERALVYDPGRINPRTDLRVMISSPRAVMSYAERNPDHANHLARIPTEVSPFHVIGFKKL